MRVWAFVSQKGGSGKSTLCTQLAVIAGQKGERVIILDLDPQGSSLQWHKLRGEGRAPVALPIHQIERLPETLRTIRETGAFTLVLLDTAPHSDRKVTDAVRLSDLVLIPTTPGAFSLGALKDTVEIIEAMSAADKSRVVVNRVRGQKADDTHKAITEVAKRAGVETLDKFVRDLVAIEKAIDAGAAVVEPGHRDKAAAADISALWDAADALSKQIDKPKLKVISNG